MVLGTCYYHGFLVALLFSCVDLVLTFSLRYQKIKKPTGFSSTTMMMMVTSKNSNNNDTTAEATITTEFPFVEKSIAEILSCQLPQEARVAAAGTPTYHHHPRKVFLDTATMQVKFSADDSVVESDRRVNPNDNYNDGNFSSHASSCPPREQPTTTKPLSAKELIPLAHECDQAIFEESPPPTPQFATTLHIMQNRSKLSLLRVGGRCASRKALIELGASGDPSKVTAATLVALNGLESAIRRRCSAMYECHTNNNNNTKIKREIKPGRTPLLKNMLQQLLLLEESNSSGSSSENSYDINKRQKYKFVNVLQLLLLPTGLNLRNILWHGFCACIPRPWLALILILTSQLDDEFEAMELDVASPTPASSMPKTTRVKEQSHKKGLIKQNKIPSMSPSSFLNNDDPCWSRAIMEGEELVRRYCCSPSPLFPLTATNGSTQSDIPSWLPATGYYIEMFELAVSKDWLLNYPAFSCALLIVLLEHGLRLQWCVANENQNRIARPHVYYVTLDGHGQRHQHDVILHPYHHQQQTQQQNNHEQKTRRNALVAELGGSRMALLTDIFLSSCGGPNVRAAFAHGVWDDILEYELAQMIPTIEKDSNHPDKKNDHDQNIKDKSTSARKILGLILLAMEEAAGCCPKSDEQRKNQAKGIAIERRCPNSGTSSYYRPTFSFTATTVQSLQDVQNLLLQLFKIKQQLCGTSFPNALESSASSKLNIPIDVLQSHVRLVLSACHWRSLNSPSSSSSAFWTSDDVFLEHRTNQQLAPLGAARTLLGDVSSAIVTYVKKLQESLEELDSSSHHDYEQSLMTSRKRKRLLRIISCRSFVLDLYSFATLVGLLGLGSELGCYDGGPLSDILTKAELLKAVERTRMVVSTAATYLTTNYERAFKATDDYTKGKTIKILLANKEEVALRYVN